MQVSKLLISIVHDFKVGIEVVGFVALALGLVYVGSCNEDVAQSIILTLMDHG
jgi:26S proteasome regulatory subunit N1